MLSGRNLIIFFMLCIMSTKLRAASIKKVISETSLKTTSSNKPSKSEIPAIIAIEIINKTESSSSATTKNNSKRTIESSLGYGYQNSFAHDPPKKFVIYKYSQHDIPPISYGPSNEDYQEQTTYQKQAGYNHENPLAQQHAIYHQQQQPVQYYNPGTTLYTTLNHQGQLGGLSNQVPYQNLGSANTVPVIFLRVYKNQLASPETALHTNLPQSHPYSNLNSINLQSLLQNYVGQYLQQNQQGAHQHHQQQHQYQEQDYQPQDEHLQTQQQQYYQQQAPNEYHSNLPTSENYPSKHHTRVIFHSNNNGHIPVVESTPPQVVYQKEDLSNQHQQYYQQQEVQQQAYVQVPTPSTQYYTYQTPEPAYMYVYPNEVDQGNHIYYQHQQPYDEVNNDANQELTHSNSAESDQDSQTPYNYHAHETQISSTSTPRRDKKNNKISVTITPRSQPIHNRA